LFIAHANTDVRVSGYPGCCQFRVPNKWPTLIETNRAVRQERREKENVKKTKG